MAKRSLSELRQRITERLKAVAAAPALAVTVAATYALLVALAVIFTRSAAPGSPVRLSDFPVGGVAHRDVVADRDVQYVDEAATRLKVEAAERLTPRVFRVNDSITRLTLDRYDQFRETFLAVFEREGSIQTAFLQMQLAMPGSLTAEQIARLNNNPVIEEILDRSRDVLEDLLEGGVLGLPEELRGDTGGATVEVWRWTRGKLDRVEIPISRVVTMEYLSDHVEAASRAVKLSRNGDSRGLLRSLVTSFIRENAFEDAEETRRSIERARAAVVPEIARLVKGQSIVRKGDIVTDETLARLRAIGAHRATVGANTVVGAALFLGIAVALAVYLFGGKRSGMTLSLPQISFLAASAVLYALWATLADRLLADSAAGLPLSVYLPTAAIGMLVSIVLTPTVAIRFTLCLAMLVVVPARLDVSAVLFALFSGVGGIAVVARAENRIDLIRAGLIISGLNLLPLFALGFMGSSEGAWFLAATVGGVANGFLCGVLALGFLPILDHALNTATRFRLMELSDVNAPILKRMLTLAPGTYSHSLAVANLAESACTAIGANHLLARVGAYYHDIGKIEQAEYFVENQTSENKHDELQPSLSVAVIKSHVKIGVERAKELTLPAEVVDIISQHHGRDLIKFFYHRARTSKDAGPVSAGDYSYKGSRPRSREAAVVMLADAVEAATRTLKRPNPARLEKAVWEIIMERFASGELSESALTFQELEVIKTSFVHVLSGHFHSRIEYPKLAGAGA